MEHHDPSRPQYAPTAFTSQQQESAPIPGQYATPGPMERFRQSAYLQQSPAAVSSAGRVGGDSQQSYGFAQGVQYAAASPMQQSSIQYGQEVRTPDTQRQQYPQYAQYGAGVVYGIGQPQPTQSPYEQASQYRQRQNTGSETLASPFGVPQTGQYYLAGQPGPASAGAPELTTQQIPSQYQQPGAYPQAGPSSAHAYPSTVMDPSQSGAYAGYAQQPHYTTQQQHQSDDQAFDRYQAQIRAIFTFAQDGSLRDIDQQLHDVSNYLLGNAEALGLTRDDAVLHDDRIRLWDEFNRAWLVTLQGQLDLTEQVVQTGRPLREPQSIMQIPSIERLAVELVRLCDRIEAHGLVDYQMGVAEEDIMDLLIRCKVLLDPNGDRTGEAEAQAESATAGATRRR